MKKQNFYQSLVQYLTEEATAETGNAQTDVATTGGFRFKYLEGGFPADGIELTPDGESVLLKIKIYGGGEPQRVRLPTSNKLKSLFRTKQSTEGDPVNQSVDIEIENEFKAFKLSLETKLLKVFQDTDLKVRQAIIDSVKEIKK